MNTEQHRGSPDEVVVERRSPRRLTWHISLDSGHQDPGRSHEGGGDTRGYLPVD